MQAQNKNKDLNRKKLETIGKYSSVIFWVLVGETCLDVRLVLGLSTEYILYCGHSP